jgi:ureidoglycolate hydrolase
MPSIRRVAVRPLDRDEFRRYGSVIEAGAVDDPSLNRAPGQMAFLWVQQSLAYPKTPFVGTCRYYYRGTRCEYVQQHPESTVVLIPIDGRPSVIWFLPDRGGQPDVDRAEAVLLDGRRGIVTNPGTWIRYAYPVLQAADFAYVSARIDPEEDIRRVYLERDHGVTLEWFFDVPPGPGVKLTEGGAVLALPAAEGHELELGIGGVIIRRGGA